VRTKASQRGDFGGAVGFASIIGCCKVTAGKRPDRLVQPVMIGAFADPDE